PFAVAFIRCNAHALASHRSARRLARALFRAGHCRASPARPRSWLVVVHSCSGIIHRLYGIATRCGSLRRHRRRMDMARASVVANGYARSAILALHMLFARDFAGLAAWTAAAIFIPAIALALGVTTGTRKAFEAIYTMWWYVGPLHHIPQVDFIGTTAQSSTPSIYLAAGMLLVLFAYSWRKVRLAY